jgi:ParB family protein of integrating conjugative element (PFGI_1 class)
MNSSNTTRLPGDTSVTDWANAKQQVQEQRDASGVGTVRQLTADELDQRMRLHMSTHPVPDHTDRLGIEMDGQVQLRITDIDPYDKNPRQVANEKYEEIKESIRNIRMQSPLIVSRRPGAVRYMVSAGGNTRLKAQTELWLETQDSRYEYVLVIYRPWESELKVLAAHITENELRGSMVFWDKARGILAMKLELERERGQSLSLRQLHDALRGYGLTVSIALLSYYSFALDNLAELGDATRWLSKTTVEALQPTVKHLSTYLISAHQQPPDAWHALRIDVLRGIAQSDLAQDADFTDETGRERTLSPETLIAALEVAVARALDQTVQQVREVRLLAKVMPKLSMADLIQQYQEIQATKQPPSRPTHPTDALPVESAVSVSLPISPRLDDAAPTNPANAGPGTASRSESKSPSVPRTSGEQTQTDPATATRATPATSDPLKDVQRHITAMARVCGFADCLRLTDAMPAGFYVESPADDTPLDLDPAHTDSRNRYVGWWLAAMHSSQIGGDYSHHMPVESTWRRAQRQESGNDENSLPWLIETVLGNPIGLVEMADWLTHPATQVIAEYHGLLRALQHLRTNATQQLTQGATS